MTWPRRVLLALGVATGLLVWIWAVLALHVLVELPALPVGLAAVSVPGLSFWRPARRWALAAMALLTVAGATLFLSQSPRDDRQWWTETSILPDVRFDDTGRVRLERVRSFRWRTPDDFDPVWRSREFRLDAVQSLDLVIEPFAGDRRFAHAMLSFGFDDGSENLVVSIEARKERDEQFGLLQGLFRQFELIYVVADERDVLTQRALARGTEVYIFPLRARPEWIRSLLADLLRRASELRDRPAFYHSVLSNCTTTLVRHVNRFADEPIRFDREVLFSGYAARMLHRHGWIATELDYDEAVRRFRADERIRTFRADEAFSTKIRAL